MPRLNPTIEPAKVLRRLYEYRRRETSWASIARKARISPNVICNVLSGKNRAPMTLLKLLKLQDEIDVIDQPTINELVELRHAAKSASETYRDAIKDQAKKHSLNAAGLKRYVNALADDKLAKLDEESSAIGELLAKQE